MGIFIFFNSDDLQWERRERRYYFSVCEGAKNFLRKTHRSDRPISMVCLNLGTVPNEIVKNNGEQ